MENYFNTKHGAIKRNYNIGDLVWVKIYRNNSWSWKEGSIIEKIGMVNYRIDTENRQVRAHTNQIRTRYSDVQ